MVTESDLELGDGRTLHFYDTVGDDPSPQLPVFWHHGTPNIGSPPQPMFAAAEARGIRWVSYDRPSYGGSTPNPGRDVATAASDVSAIADTLGIKRFAVFGHSGGGPHALACAALLPDRVIGAVSGSALAPPYAEGLDWFAGMIAGSAGELRAAASGRAALELQLLSAGFDPEMFTTADEAALGGDWSWMAKVAGQAINQGIDGMVDDALASVAPWGFDVASITRPVLYLHGRQDRIVPVAHGEWLARHTPSSELWLRPDEGHVSVLSASDEALDWLVQQARQV